MFILPMFLFTWLPPTSKSGMIKIYYQINDQPEKLYTGIIEGFQKNSHYLINIRGVDLLGNQQSDQIEFYTAE